MGGGGRECGGGGSGCAFVATFAFAFADAFSDPAIGTDPATATGTGSAGCRTGVASGGRVGRGGCRGCRCGFGLAADGWDIGRCGRERDFARVG